MSIIENPHARIEIELRRRKDGSMNINIIALLTALVTLFHGIALGCSSVQEHTRPGEFLASAKGLVFLGTLKEVSSEQGDRVKTLHFGDIKLVSGEYSEPAFILKRDSSFEYDIDRISSDNTSDPSLLHFDPRFWFGEHANSFVSQYCGVGYNLTLGAEYVVFSDHIGEYYAIEPIENVNDPWLNAILQKYRADSKKNTPFHQDLFLLSLFEQSGHLDCDTREQTTHHISDETLEEILDYCDQPNQILSFYYQPSSEVSDDDMLVVFDLNLMLQGNFKDLTDTISTVLTEN